MDFAVRGFQNTPPPLRYSCILCRKNCCPTVFVAAREFVFSGPVTGAHESAWFEPNGAPPNTIIGEQRGVEREHVGRVRFQHEGQIRTLNSSPFFTESAKAAINRGIASRSARFTTSTGECM